jgi:predicted DCC family thiol-disulfide oxidoreductase YuxK
MRVYQRGAISVSTALTVLDCAACGMLYGITAELESRRRGDGANFYCPNGHPQMFSETEDQRLRKRLREAEERAAAILAQRDQAYAEAAEAIKAQRRTEQERKRLEKRVSAGVCAWCHRTVAQLADHVRSKHPEHAPVASPAAMSEFRPCPDCGLRYKNLGAHRRRHRR